MQLEVIKDFLGFNTEADNYSSPGSIDMQNVDINEYNDIVKSKGYSLVGSEVARATIDTETDVEIETESGLVLEQETQLLEEYPNSEGFFYDGNYLYAFLGDSDGTYLFYSSPTTIRWRYVEATPTLFENGFNAQFVKDDDNIVFVKGEKKTIGGNDGGVFYFNASTVGSTVLAHFGSASSNLNPTGKYIEKHNERLFVGGITYTGDTSVNGESWIEVSKVFPEAEDTVYTITATSVNGTRTKLHVVDHLFNVGDKVYIEGITADVGTDYLNGKYFDIIETDTDYIYIDIDTSSATNPAADGTVTLRNKTWCPGSSEFNEELVGAGIFKCDDDDDDVIMAIASKFGVLAILRKKSVYFMTGSIVAGNASLARKIDVPFGAISSSIGKTSGGIWFLSKYGLCKIEGVNVKTTTTELDNILSINQSYNIKSAIDDISVKENVIIHGFDRYVWVHDPANKITYVLDTLNGNWFKHTQKLIDFIVEVDNYTYSLYNNYVFKLNDSYNYYDLLTGSEKPVNSYYVDKLRDQGSSFLLKHYVSLFSLIQGYSSDDADVSLYIDLYHDGELDTSSKTIEFDIKTGTEKIWEKDPLNPSKVYLIEDSSVQTWNDVIDTTQTWNAIVGRGNKMLKKHAYNLGWATSIQFKIRHNSNSGFKISNIQIGYDETNVNKMY